MVYIVEGPKYTHNDSNDVPQTEKKPIETIFDIFDFDPH